MSSARRRRPRIETPIDGTTQLIGLDLSEHDVPKRGQGWFAIYFLVASVYCLVFTLAGAIGLTGLLQGSDREVAEASTRGVLFPLGDAAIFLQGITQAFSGYLFSGAVPLVLSALPMLVIALVIAVAHTTMVGLLLSGVVWLVRREPQRRSS